MTLYAQRAYVNLLSDPEAKEKHEYANWLKRAKPSPKDTIMEAILAGQRPKPK